MANDFVKTTKVRVLGTTYDDAVTVSADNAVKTIKSAMAAAKVGALTTYTDTNTGVLTMNSGHGFTDSVRLDVYWTLSGVNYARRGMTVGTVATNSVPIDGGAGDDLPPDETPITAMVPTAEAVTLTGNNVVGLVAYSSKSALVVFTDGSDVEKAAIHIAGDGYSYIWDSDTGVTNPLAGDTPTKIYFSHGYSGGTADVESVVLYN